MFQDLRYGARLLRLNPGFALVAVLSLALGIGANTAIFQLLDAVRMRALPVKNPRDLAIVRIADRKWSQGNFSSRYSELSNPLWEQLRDHQQAFDPIAAWSPSQFNLATGGEIRNAEGMWVSGNFFRALEVPALLGRVITAADDRRGCGSPGAVVSYAFWQREFAGEASALGRKLMLDGHPFEVIGVTPPDFFGVEIGRSFDVAIPICADKVMFGNDSKLDKRHFWWLAALGRLKPGWTMAGASAHLKTISPGLMQATLPEAYQPDAVKKYLEYRLGAFPAESGFSRLREYYQNPLWLLLATAGLVLLIACANLASLMLARASAREREIAVRLAMGASRARLIRQLLAESLLMAAAGAGLGALLAGILSRSLVAFLSTADNPLFLSMRTDWRVLAFTAGLAVATCVLFGLAPAVRATSTAPGAVLKSAGRGLAGNRERFGLRRALVVAQIALSLVLFVGALLFSGSLRNLLALDAGFRQDGILVVALNMTRMNVPVDRRNELKRRVLERLRAIPGVESAATVSHVPISGNSWNELLLDERSKERLGVVWFERISSRYFATLGTPMLAGRDFDERDSVTSPKVAIVNEEYVRKILKGAPPLGKRFRIQEAPGEPEPVYTIVGVVKNAKYQEMREEFKPIAYVSYSQIEKPGLFEQAMIRSGLSVAGLVGSVKRTIADESPDIDLSFTVFRTEVRNSLLRERLMATLSGFFGILAGVLATVGVYGVISYMVARRRNEIGIRMALGADREMVIGMVLREAALLLAMGLAGGTLVALLVTRTASSLLFGVKPHDPLTIAVAVVALAAIALAASFVPARRAAALNPMEALRDE